MSKKAAYINFLETAIDTQREGDNKGFLTYITANGIVCGKSVDPEEFDTSSYEAVQDSLSKALAESEDGIDVFSIANAFFHTHYGESKDLVNPAIKLTDVSIKFSNNDILNVDHYILFADQVIGILPGKLDLASMKIN